MALIKCEECGKEISDKAASCPNCGAPVVPTNNVTIPKQFRAKSVKEKKKVNWLKILLIVIAVYIVLGCLSGAFGGEGEEKASQDSISQENESVNNADSTDVSSETEESNAQDSAPTMSREDFIASCQEFNYKTIARNPDDYIGQNFVVDVQIFETANGKWYTGYDTYYKAYTNDEYDLWMGDFLYIIDCQDKDSETHVKVLDDDIIRVYGTFNGMLESQNSITGTTNDEVALNMHYCELLSE